MYILRKEKAQYIKETYKQIKMAKEIGISNTHLSLMLNHNKECSKPVAYCITKYVNEDAEIEDFFKRI